MIIVFGASGFLGRYLFNFFSKKYRGVLGTYCSKKCEPFIKYELTNPAFPASSMPALKGGIKYAVICMGKTRIDEIKKEPGHFEATNVQGTLTLLKELKKRDIFPIYISTDNVFSGNKGDYRETDLREPINLYGKQKVQVENFIVKNLPQYLIIRTSKLYSEDAVEKNWLCEWMKAFSRGKELPCDTSQVFCPTHVDDICWGIYKLINSGSKGIYHVAALQKYTRYELAGSICEELRVSRRLISPVEINHLGLLEKRPLNIGLDCSKFQKETHHQFKEIKESIKNTNVCWKLLDRA